MVKTLFEVGEVSAPTLLFLLGIFGTVIGIVLSFSAQQNPVTPEEVKVFGVNILSGMGLAYMTSAVGIGGSVTLYWLDSFGFQPCANALKVSFRELLFETVFPVIDGDTFDLQPEGESHVT